jgi:hypothetical protein
VKQIEAVITAQNGRKIKALSGTEVTDYIDMPGRRNRRDGWQFAQRIDALRILCFDLLSMSVCQEVGG